MPVHSVKRSASNNKLKRKASSKSPSPHKSKRKSSTPTRKSSNTPTRPSGKRKSTKRKAERKAAQAGSMERKSSDHSKREAKRKGSDLESSKRKGSDLSKPKRKSSDTSKRRTSTRERAGSKPTGGVQQKRREVFRSDVIEPRFWKGTKIILTLECEQCVLRVKTLCETPILDLKGKLLNHIPTGTVIEVRNFSVKKIGKTMQCVAPVVQGATQGYILLNDGTVQQVELTKETLQNCHVRMYKNEKRLLRHKWLTTWPLRCVHYETEDIESPNNMSFTLRYALRDENDIKIFNASTKEIYLAWLYLFSSNRELSRAERMTRAAQGFGSPEEIAVEFERVVLFRLAPSQRARYRNTEYLMKIEMINTYRDLIASKTMQDYLDSLSKSNVSAVDLALVRGALDDNDLDWAEVFVEDLGITRIISAVESKAQDDNAIWEINKVALECFETIMDKPPLTEGGKSGLDLIIGQKLALSFIINQLEHPNEEVRQRVIFLIKVAWYASMQSKTDDAEETINSIKDIGREIINILTKFAGEHEAKSLWEVFIVEMAHDPTNVHYAANILALINCLMESYKIDDRIEAREIIDETPLNDIIARINEHISENKDEFLSDMSDVLDLYDDELQKFNDSRDMDQRAVTYNSLNLSDPEALFEYLYTVCIEDGNIDELRRCLHSLILIPREFSDVWSTATMALEKTAHFINDELNEFVDDPTGDEAKAKVDANYKYIIENIDARNSELDPAAKLREASKNLEELDHLRREVSQAEKDIKERNERIDSLEEEISDLISTIQKFEADKVSLAKEKSALQIMYDEAQKKYGEMEKQYGETKNSLVQFKRETAIKAQKKLEDLKKQDRVLKRQGTELEMLKRELEQAQLSLERVSSAASPISVAAKEVEPELPEELLKFWRMLKMKVPKSAILNKMKQDKIAPERFEEVKQYMSGSAKKVSEPILPKIESPKSVSFVEPKKEEVKIPDDLKKYHRMLTKMKIPAQAIKNKMKMDGIDPARICEIDGTGKKKEGVAKPIQAEISKELKKYHMMLTKMKIPSMAVQNKMKMDGIDPARICEIDGSGGGSKPAPIPEDLKKYHRMLTKMKIPASAVQNKMKMDGIDPSRICEIDGSGSGSKPAAIPEDLKKYHRMLTKMKIPASAVRNKMKMDGINPDRISEIDGSGGGKKRSLKRNRSTVATKKLNQRKKKFLNINMGKSVAGSRFWAGYSSEVTQEIEEKELVEWFGKEDRKKENNTKRKRAKKRKLAERENLVDDGKKSRALEIFMGVLKRKRLSLDQIKKSMWKLDEVLIDNSLLESLMEVMPDAGEVDRARAFTGKESNLNVPSQFFWALRLVPRPKQRAKLWLVKRRFHESIAKVDDGLGVLKHAVHTISGSPSLKNCFFCILKYLNAVSGTMQTSFRLRVLASVNSKKTRKSSTTFLQYFIRKLIEKGESNLDFIEELSCLNEAERKDCGVIRNNIDEMKANMRQVTNSLKAYGKPVVEPDCIDNYKFVMTEFTKTGNEKIKELSKQLEELETFITNLAGDLGEQPRDENGMIDLTFVKTINKFRKDVKKAVKLNAAEDKKIKRRQRIKRQEEEKKKKAEERKKKREARAAAKRQTDSPSNHVQNNSPLKALDAASTAQALNTPHSLPTDLGSSLLTVPSPSGRQSKRTFSIANLDMKEITGKRRMSLAKEKTHKKHKSVHHSRASSLMPKTKQGFLNQVDKNLKTGTKKKAERIRKRTRGRSIRDHLKFAANLNTAGGSPMKNLSLPGEMEHSPLSPFGLGALSEGVASITDSPRSAATVELHFPSTSAMVEHHFPSTATVERHFPSLNVTQEDEEDADAEVFE